MTLASNLARREVVSNVAYAERFHAGPGIGLVVAVKWEAEGGDATTTPFLDPWDMGLRAEEAGWCRHAMT